MGSWPPISPLLSPYGNGFGDPQGIMYSHKVTVYCILANSWLTCCMMFKLAQVVMLIITFIQLSLHSLIHAGMHQGMLSPGLVPPPGPSPLPHFGTAFGSWESPPYSPTSYRQFPTPGTPCNGFVQFCSYRACRNHGKYSLSHNTLIFMHLSQLEIYFLLKRLR